MVALAPAPSSTGREPRDARLSRLPRWRRHLVQQSWARAGPKSGPTVVRPSGASNEPSNEQEWRYDERRTWRDPPTRWPGTWRAGTRRRAVTTRARSSQRRRRGRGSTTAGQKGRPASRRRPRMTLPPTAKGREAGEPTTRPRRGTSGVVQPQRSGASSRSPAGPWHAEHQPLGQLDEPGQTDVLG